MSGIYIKGMELPKEGCHHMICIYADGTVSTGGKTYRAESVPDHGRLIDADALFEEVYKVWGTEYDASECNSLMSFINAAPTIIPASIGDENG